MMADAEAGVIDGIIVKDLSRFGRNAVDAGFYIERRLPALHVRFISITDDFDSINGDGGTILVIKNLVNETYAIDIGRKRQAVHTQHIKDGKFVGRLAPYGYALAPNDCHKLVIDEEAAPIVRQVFEWASRGENTREIARRLNKMGLPSPSQYFSQKGFIISKGTAKQWHYNSALFILTDRAYVGDMVQGKTKTVNHIQVKTQPDEWIVVPNTHEPIISRDLFEKVQEVFKQTSCEIMKNRNPVVPYKPSFFVGKVFCGHCGYALHRKRENKDGIYVFRCTSQQNYSESACMQVSIKEEDLKSAAVAMLHKYAETLLGRKLRLCRKAAETTVSGADARTELSKVRQEMNKNRDTLKMLFEQLVSGTLTPDEFSKKKQANSDKLTALTERALELETSPKHLESRIKECWELSDCVSATECKYDLTAEILDSLVEKILVYHDKSFEIVWRFADEFWGSGVAS